MTPRTFLSTVDNYSKSWLSHAHLPFLLPFFSSPLYKQCLNLAHYTSYFQWIQRQHSQLIRPFAHKVAIGNICHRSNNTMDIIIKVIIIIINIIIIDDLPLIHLLNMSNTTFRLSTQADIIDIHHPGIRTKIFYLTREGCCPSRIYNIDLPRGNLVPDTLA